MTVTRSRVIVGVDESAAGLAALRWAISQAGSQRADLIAIRTWAPSAPPGSGAWWRAPRVFRRGRRTPVRGGLLSGMQRRETARLLVARAFGTVAGSVPEDVPILIETPEGNPGAVLTRWACRDGDTLIVGTGRKSRSWPGMSRSVSRYCLKNASCPVVTVPEPAAPPAGLARDGLAALQPAGGGLT